LPGWKAVTRCPALSRGAGFQYCRLGFRPETRLARDRDRSEAPFWRTIKHRSSRHENEQDRQPGLPDFVASKRNSC